MLFFLLVAFLLVIQNDFIQKPSLHSCFPFGGRIKVVIFFIFAAGFIVILIAITSLLYFRLFFRDDMDEPQNILAFLCDREERRISTALFLERINSFVFIPFAADLPLRIARAAYFQGKAVSQFLFRKACSLLGRSLLSIDGKRR